ncbi:hypothetical protein GQ457_14G011070 [Hibiscus cannabinus]
MQSTTSDSWVVDSGATHHVTLDASKVAHGVDYTGPGMLVVGNGHSLPINKTGQFALLSDSRLLLLNNLIHVPQVTKNLLSVSKFVKDNMVFVEFRAKSCCVRDESTREVLLQGKRS